MKKIYTLEDNIVNLREQISAYRRWADNTATSSDQETLSINTVGLIRELLGLANDLGHKGCSPDLASQLRDAWRTL